MAHEGIFFELKKMITKQVNYTLTNTLTKELHWNRHKSLNGLILDYWLCHWNNMWSHITFSLWYQTSMSAPPIMETVHKYVPTPLEATTVRASLVISLVVIAVHAMVTIHVE